MCQMIEHARLCRPYLAGFLPGRLRRRFADKFDLDVELLTSLQLMLLQEAVSVDSWLNCNTNSESAATLNRLERLFVIY